MQSRKRRAAIYARYSSDQQSDRSIEDQITLCREYADRQNLSVVATYEDRAMTSASLIGRDGVLDLMADAQSGKFDLVVVEAFDRLSRDQADLAGIHKRLNFAQVEIFAVHDGQADVMKIGLQGLMGEMFLQQLKEKTRRGLVGRVKSGRSAGGLSFGYRPVPGQSGELTIDEEEAAVVRRIYDEYAGGKTPRNIAIDLNNDGIVPPRGTVWNASTVNGHKERGYGILHNELYAGVRVWNRVKMVRNPETGRRVNRTNPKSEWVREPVPDLRIVTEEQWQAVRAEMDKRTNGPRGRGAARAPKRPLSGLLKCGKCGGGMFLKKREKSGALYIQCSRSVNSGTCANKRQARLDKIETQLFTKLAAELQSPIYIEAYLGEYRRERAALARNAVQDRAKLTNAATKAAAAFTRAQELYIAGIIEGDEGVERVRAAKMESEAATARLEHEAPEIPNIELHPATARKHIAALGQISDDLNAGRLADLDAVNSLRDLISHITVTPKEKGHDAVVYGEMAEIIGQNKKPGGMVVAWGRLELPTYRL